MMIIIIIIIIMIVIVIIIIINWQTSAKEHELTQTQK